MIRSWMLAAIAGALVACSSIDAVGADPLPTQTFKILPAALAAEAAIASCLATTSNTCGVAGTTGCLSRS